MNSTATPETRTWLLAMARHALAQSLGGQAPDPGPAPLDPALHAPARVFVSWHDGPELVGCIGTLHPAKSLMEAVSRYAIAAGDDPRTPPLQAATVGRLHCEISILGELRALDAIGFEPIALALASGRYGVLLRDDAGHSAFFLPIVWESLPDPHLFLTALARKAGIDLHRSRDHIRAEVLEATAFSASGPE